MSAAALLDRLRQVLGPNGLIEDPAALAPYCADWRGIYKGAALAVARPADATEAAAVVKLCAATRTAIVPQGGNTGLSGGAIPDAGGGQLVLSLARMNRIREVDPVDNTITVEAGCILAEIQAAAKARDRLFPLSLAAEGSCQIGGNLSTNAGGVNVLRYGNARDLVLGLEVVLPDGEIWSGLKSLRKDNTGYDLKQLFVGAEGTLGIITAAVLKLFPLPRSESTAMLALAEPAAALDILSRAQGATGAVSSCELMPRIALEMVLKHIPGRRDPFGQVHPWYLLLQFSSQLAGDGLGGAVEGLLAEAAEAGLIADAVLAGNLTQAGELWSLRENISEAQRHEGAQIKHDISVPIRHLPAFLDRAQALVAGRWPGVRVVAFGHVGDGNIHFNLSQDPARPAAEFQAQTGAINQAVHDIVHALGGSISAEHGLGQLRRDESVRYKQPIELALMRRLKTALDPQGLMNPGKLLS